MRLEFLELEDVLEIHQLQIEEFGGSSGLRDRGLLESAISQPQASFDGKYVHRDIFEMAGAYLFHLIRNHPFVDGNKRTALMAALVFLDLNGVAIHEESPALYELTMSAAEGRLDKVTVTQQLRSIARAAGFLL